MKSLQKQCWADQVRTYGIYGFALHSSIHVHGHHYYAVTQHLDREYLVVYSTSQLPDGFTGVNCESGKFLFRFCDFSSQNAAELRKMLPVLKPSREGGGMSKTSFGIGNTLSFSSAGLIPFFERKGILPVFSSTPCSGVGYRAIIDAVTWSVFRFGCKGSWVAEASGIQEVHEVQEALEQGCTKISVDLSGSIDYSWENAAPTEIAPAYAALETTMQRLAEAYPFWSIPGSSRDRTALICNRAVTHAEELYRAAAGAGKDFDFEISLSESSWNTPEEVHGFLAWSLQQRGVSLTSCAPRLFKTEEDGAAFEEYFRSHAGIAAKLGYKLSVHAINEKLSLLIPIARNLEGAIHLATKESDWLVALELLSGKDPESFKEIITYALGPGKHTEKDLSKSGRMDPTALFGDSEFRMLLQRKSHEVMRINSFRNRLIETLAGNLNEYWYEIERDIGRYITTIETLHR